ncbi:MAG: UDP-2,3-diacylglucosamine diphosphatase LpxI [Rickettsiales bacterium]|nr:UDP-2,3-diacylglucosamine diphosphatase LpxI [Rickettsiales bacterium]
MEKIGIISGSGSLPYEIAEIASKKGIETFFVFLKGSAEETLENLKKNKKKTNIKFAIAEKNFIWSSITNVGKILDFFRENSVQHLLLAGGIKRPPLLSLIPDLTGAKLLKRLISLKNAGDDSALREIIKFLEEHNFSVIGVSDIAPELLTKKGFITKNKPNERQLFDIQKGFEVAKTLGNLDIGQAVIVQDGEVLGVEGAEGTSELIKRCAKLQRGGKGAILVKSCKPSQDKRADLPSIGINTIYLLKDLKFSGVALSAEESIILDFETTKHQAEKDNIFIYSS